MERAKKMLSMALKKQTQLFDALEPSTSNENNENWLNGANKVTGISGDQDLQSNLDKENEGYIGEENVVSFMVVEEENLKDFDDDDSLCDPNFVPSDSENVSNESDNALDNTTKSAGSQEQNNILFGACESVSSENGEEIKGTAAKRPRKMRKEKRNSGKSYISTAGKIVPERTLRKLENCRKKCSEKISLENQQLIFKRYWELGSYEMRQAFASGLIVVEDTKFERKERSQTNPRKRNHTNKYFLEINGERVSVCQKCFRYTLCESEQFIKTVVKKKFEGSFTKGDMRGKHKGPKQISNEKENEIIEFIKSFPSYESHYTRRDTSQRNMASDLSIAELFRLYSEKNDPISLSKFSKIFHTLNLKFKKPKIDTCHKCEILKMKIDVSTEEELESLKQEQRNHHLEAENAYKSKAADKLKGEHNSFLKVLTFDLQQCLPTSFLRSSVSFYKRPLWTYNLTVHDCITGQPVCYMWHEAIGNRGGNEIASCVFNHLQNLPPNTRHVILYSDCCPGQNKNSFIASMFETFLQLDNNVETIDHKFLIPGHTHMECDIDHALIEKKKRLTTLKIHHPRDWYQFVRTVGVKHKFDVKEINQDQIFNFSAISKEKFTWRKVDNDRQKFNWLNVKWMRFTKEFGTIYFKTSLNEIEDFKTVNIIRRGFNSIKITDLKKCYNTSLEINEKKKQDLLDMLPLIDDIYHPFYQNLNTNQMADFHPDLTEGGEEDT